MKTPIVARCVAIAYSIILGTAHAQVTLTATVNQSGSSFQYGYSATNTGTTPIGAINIVVTGDQTNLQAPPGWQAQQLTTTNQKLVQWIALNTADDLAAGASLSGFVFTSTSWPGSVEYGSIDETPAIYDGSTVQGPAHPLSQLANISTRAHVQTGDNVMIAGFIISNQPQQVLIRAIGPSLARFNVPELLGDPTVTLYNSSGAPIASNDNWQTTIIDGTIITADQVNDIKNSGLAPNSDNESAILATLPAGSYTAIVRGAGGTSGNGVVEVYALPSGSQSNLANISTRCNVQPGDNVMIGGFIIIGQSQKVLIRAVGPSLSQYNVPNVLADPILTLYDIMGNPIASNDNWQTTVVDGTTISEDRVTDIENTGNAPMSSNEAAILTTLTPGSYTAIVRGVAETSGNGLVELYTIP